MNLIYYFTGTGNSKMLAEVIAGKLEDTKIVKITKNTDTNIDFSNVERIGFVVPVYAWGLPLMVVSFLEKLNIPENIYIFGVANFGGSCGPTLLQMNDIISSRLRLGIGIKMPANFIPMYNSPSLDKQKVLIKNAEDKIDKNIDFIKNKQTKKIESSSFIFNFIAGVLYKKFAPQFRFGAKNFHVDESCNGCGYCASICPAENIRIVDNKPNWSLNCEQCLACLHLCPQKAVQYGNKTQNKTRYKNMNIDAI